MVIKIEKDGPEVAGSQPSKRRAMTRSCRWQLIAAS